MSRELIDHSADLTRLKEQGYSLRVIDDGILVVDDIAYVTPDGAVQRGILAMALSLQGDVTTKPPDHVAHWSGDMPHNAQGKALAEQIGGDSTQQTISQSLPPMRMLSARADYSDYYHKVSSYVELISREARLVNGQ